MVYQLSPGTCGSCLHKKILRSLAEGHPWNPKVRKPSMLLE